MRLHTLIANTNKATSAMRTPIPSPIKAPIVAASAKYPTIIAISKTGLTKVEANNKVVLFVFEQ